MRKYLLFILLSHAAVAIAEDEEEQLELIKEVEFEVSKGNFNPWYTGPLITGSSNVVPVGSYNIQPYLYLIDFFAEFDKHGKPHSIPNWFQWRGIGLFQFGITESINGFVIGTYVGNDQKGHHASHFGDTSIGFNFGLMKEGLYNPGILFAITETFPSGRYQRLNPKKFQLEATGGGSFLTTFTLNIGKVVWWLHLDHPMDFRVSLNYQIATRAEVNGFNTYGGGFDTKGKVHPGSTFAADFGYQFSFDQRWVFALDFVYAFTLKSTFSGRPGFDEEGNVAKVGIPFNDNISILPAIEYNWNENLGVNGGIWFSPWGRDSLQFVGGVFSVTYTW